jgi:hypothetical protein
VGTAPSATGFFVFEQYWNGNCESKPGVVGGLATDVCFVITDINSNTTIGSASYSYDSSSNDNVHAHFVVYKGDSCEIEVEQIPFDFPEMCTQDVEDGFWFQASYSTDTEIYNTLGAGLLVSPYDTEEHCETDDVYGQFSLLSLNVCVGTDNPDSFLKLSQCEVAGKTYDMEFYSGFIFYFSLFFLSCSCSSQL